MALAKLERYLCGEAHNLRREGMDAATYKNFIFATLFSKQTSNVFLASRDNLTTTGREPITTCRC